MKKIIAFILVCCLVFCVGCNGKSPNGNENPPIESDRLKTVEEIMSAASPNDLSCSKYQLKKYAAPYWSNQIIYNETVMFVSRDGKIADKKLMYKPAKILEVRDYSLKTLYTEGTDYQMTADGIKFIGKMPLMQFNDFFVEKPVSSDTAFTSITYPDRYLRYTEGDYFVNRQICVTYIRTQAYDGPKQECKNLLSKTVQKLKNKESLKMVYYGDSLMVGCNASGFSGYEPFMPIYSTMITQKLQEYYGYNTKLINTVNTSVGGWLSETGKGDLKARVLDENPDIVIIGFGGNDGTFKVSAENYGNNILFMLNKIKQKNPDCEVILISAACQNKDALRPDGTAFWGLQDEYPPILEEIQTMYSDVVHINISAIYDWLLLRKDYEDMTASFMGHPSDFFARIFAQTILTQLIENHI